MKWFPSKLSKSSKIFLAVLPVALFLALVVLFISEKRLEAQADCGCSLPSPDATGQFDYSANQAIFNNELLAPELAQQPIPESLADKQVLGEATDDNKWIEIDLSDQKLYAHNGDKIDYEFLVSTGLWAPTPTGEFRIWSKLKYTRMVGGNKEKHTYYNLPNVPFTQYFYQGFALHGAYWHNNFGHPMSHGCVNISVANAEKLFYWTSPPYEQGKGIVYPTKDNPGTRIVIHD